MVRACDALADDTAAAAGADASDVDRLGLLRFSSLLRSAIFTSGLASAPAHDAKPQRQYVTARALLTSVVIECSDCMQISSDAMLLQLRHPCTASPELRHPWTASPELLQTSNATIK